MTVQAVTVQAVTSEGATSEGATSGGAATGTRLTYVEQGAYLDGLDSPGGRRVGTTGQLERLAAVLNENS